MKKRIITWVLLLMLITAEICPVKIQGAVQPAPEISAPGAVLMEPSTGTVLYEKKRRRTAKSGKHYQNHDSASDF